MNVYLNTPAMGRPTGTYEVHSSTPETATLRDHLGGLFQVPVSSVTEDIAPPFPPELAPEAPSEDFPGFAPHEQRVLAEYVELSDRIGKLNGFLTDEGKLAALERETIDDLFAQHRAMRGYQDTLFTRIKKFGGKDAVDAPDVHPGSIMDFSGEWVFDEKRNALVRPSEEPVARFEVDDYTEAVAQKMYDNYSSAVGGVAYNGDPLPPASEFFEDARKQKQANAWRVTAFHAIDRVVQDTLKNIDEASAGEVPMTGEERQAFLDAGLSTEEATLDDHATHVEAHNAEAAASSTEAPDQTPPGTDELP